MDLLEVSGTYTILKLAADQAIPDWATQGSFFAVVKTAEEVSIVCESSSVPPEIENKSGQWKCLKVEGLLDFAQTGILSSIAGPLAKAKISIFAISTFNTDYILVKSDMLERAKEALKKSGIAYVR